MDLCAFPPSGHPQRLIVPDHPDGMKTSVGARYPVVARISDLACLVVRGSWISQPRRTEVSDLAWPRGGPSVRTGRVLVPTGARAANHLRPGNERTPVGAPGVCNAATRQAGTIQRVMTGPSRPSRPRNPSTRQAGGWPPEGTGGSGAADAARGPDRCQRTQEPLTPGGGGLGCREKSRSCSLKAREESS